MTSPVGALTARVRGALARPRTWAVAMVLLSVLVIASISYIHFRQRAVLSESVSVLERVRRARADLAKGFLHVSLAGAPGSPFDRAQGLAYLEQATSSFEEALRWQAADGPRLASRRTAEDFRARLDGFRAELATWKASGGRRADWRRGCASPSTAWSGGRTRWTTSSTRSSWAWPRASTAPSR